MEQFGPLVVSIIGAMVSNRQDAEELVHDVFIRAFSSIGHFDPQKATFATWIGRIARNCAIDRLRHSRPPHVQLPEMTYDPPEPDERLPLLDQALERLSPEERMVITLAYLDEMPLDEVAAIMESNANAISSRLYRIKNKLASIINELERRT